MGNALEIKNLTKKYSDFTLDNVNITLPSGCIMGFIGENGSGKSTTIKLILNLIHRDSGEINILGTKLDDNNKQLKEHIGVVMDESNFPDNLTATDISSIMQCCYKTWHPNIFEQYLSKFSLPGRKKVKDFSRGMKMKLSIAVALSHDSQLLILDEATSGLDPIVRNEILDEFLEFIQDENKSIFISSHILSDLEKICDYITFIHKGKIIFSDDKESLLKKYAVVKCSKDELETLDRSSIIGVRKNAFGIEALVIPDQRTAAMVTDPASIEDIMLYYAKESK